MRVRIWVIRHGPHVLRALELYRDHLIAYSLGTFSYGNINVKGVSGVTCVYWKQATMRASGSSWWENWPVQLPPGIPGL